MLSEVQKLLGLNICFKTDNNLLESQTLKQDLFRVITEREVWKWRQALTMAKRQNEV